MGLDHPQTAAEAEQYAALHGIRLTAADREAIMKAQAAEQRRFSAINANTNNGGFVGAFNRLYPRFLEALIGTGEVLMTLTSDRHHRVWSAGHSGTSSDC